MRRINKTISQRTMAVFMQLCFVFSFVVIFSGDAKAADVAEVQSDINDTQKAYNKAVDKLENTKGSLNVVQSAVISTESAIVKTEKEIAKTENTIKRKEEDIESLNKKMDAQKEILKKLLQEIYYNQNQPLAYVMLGDNFLESAVNLENLSSVGDKVLMIANSIKEDKEKLEQEKSDLENVKGNHQELLEIRDDQMQSLLIDKANLQVAVKKQEISVNKLKQKLSDLKNELTKMLGKSYNVNDIEDAAKIASKATGVRKDYIMGMLAVESDLGRYTGGCDYKQSRMSDYRKNIFLDICDELKIDPKKMKVSCPPRSYAGTGGAMGVAQFMSDTWLGYKSKIALNTGNNPPNPWGLIDGVMAMALKLQNDGAANGGSVKIIDPCNRSKKISVKWEEYASLKYLGWSCYGLNNYAQNVQYWADNYEKLLQ